MASPATKPPGSVLVSAGAAAFMAGTVIALACGMAFWNSGVLGSVVVAAVVGFGGCGGGRSLDPGPADAGGDGGGGGGDAYPNTGGNAGGDAGGDAGIDAGGDACPGTPGVSTKGEVPTEHRATAKTCDPSTAPPGPDGGLAACTTDADCAGDAGAYNAFSHCLHGLCSFDQCLTDSDCPNAVCGCAADYYGGNVAFHPNVCVTGNCRTDADCGAGGACSPSRGRCGTYEGFYCHGAADSCVNATTDCGSCGYACVYAPTAGAFVCGGAICNG
jgi:hypothetical protein